MSKATEMSPEEKKRRYSLRSLDKIDKIILQRNCKSIRLSYDYTDLYDIKDALGRELFRAFLLSESCIATCGGRCREETIQVIDLEQNQMFSFKRNIGCNTCFCPFCLRKFLALSATEEEIGTVNQQWTFARSAFCIRDKDGDPLYYIRGPWCLMKCCKGVNYEILSTEGELMGSMVKKWGITQHGTSKCNDIFEVNFLMHISKNQKILIMGAAFLIEIMYY